MESIPFSMFLTSLGIIATALLVFSGVVVLVLSLITAHTVILVGHRVSDDEPVQNRDAQWYRFAIQNAEDVPIRADQLGVAKLQLKIKVDGRFLSTADLERLRAELDKNPNATQGSRGWEGGGNPALFGGPHPTPLGGAEGGSVYRIEFSELPAYDTWVIEFWTDPGARTVSLEIEELDSDGNQAERRLARIRPTRLVLDGSRSLAVKGQLRTPGIIFGGIAIVATGVTYLALAGWQAELPWTWAVPYDWKIDVPIALALATAAGLMFAKFRRSNPMIAQGYLEETSAPARELLEAAPDEPAPRPAPDMELEPER